MTPKDYFDRLTNVYRLPLLAILVATAYYISAKFGLSLSFKPDYIAALWPPNAILLAALFLTKPKNWAWFLLAIVPAELAADLPSGIPVTMALGFVTADWVEVLIATILLRKYSETPPDFKSLRQTTIYIICCGLIAPLVSAFPGAVITGLGHTEPTYIVRWTRWFLSDSITHLLITPFIVLWISWKRTEYNPQPVIFYFELFSLSVMLSIVSLTALGFSGRVLNIETFPAILYLPLPILLWASVRFGPRGIFSSSVFVTIVYIWSGSHGYGPFIMHSAAENVFNLQIFLGITLTPLLFLSALIEEHRQSEKHTRESEQRFRDLTESTSDWVWEVDREGVYTYCSPKVTELLGYEPKEIIGKTPFDFMPSEEANRVSDIFYSFVSSQQPFVSLENSNVHKNGNLVVMETSGVPIFTDDGELLGYRGIDRDITERKRAEEVLRKSEEKLARSSKMESLGLLAGGVAHDLNNILSGIVSYPELILVDLPKVSKLRKPIETMQESGHRAAAVVQDLLTVARGVALTMTPLNLNDVVNHYLQSPEFKKIEQHHIAVLIKSNLDRELLNINGSQSHINKVIMNLVSNASEAIVGSGHVTISTTNCYFDRPLGGYDDVKIGEYATLSVSDDGPGIPAGDLERIFEPFYTKKVMGRSGTGLGLAVVWNVVQDHKGYIDVTTGENGTTFELYFPITREKILGKGLSLNIEDIRGNGETILVVDDEESQREISCKMLDTLGYKTMSISSGEEAVEYLKEHTVDLIVLDMIMDPGIDGRETYERVIKSHPEQKAVIISGFAETDQVKEAQKLGAGRYIKKPVTLEKIGVAIKEELAK
jgi:PAS domain S-box-containing protein